MDVDGFPILLENNMSELIISWPHDVKFDVSGRGVTNYHDDTQAQQTHQLSLCIISQ